MRGSKLAIAERLINVNGVGLCTESFGDPADPPIVLVMGLGSSMLWWEGVLPGARGAGTVRDPLRPTRHRQAIAGHTATSS
jgi:pimeloyl-ACP methyl ester carboxylesterase